MITCSVVICAYTMDRWSDLSEAVHSVTAGDHVPEEVLVVIDHNTDLLARAQTLSQSDPAVTVIANTHRRGLSGARNTALELAIGDVVAFLDDDAAAAPSWLATLLHHYEDPEVIGVGGTASPAWPDALDGVRPAIYPKSPAISRGDLDWVVGCTYHGQPEAPARVRNLMGCNMSFRRAVFQSVGGFSEDLGRVGKTPLGGEETEFCIRARRHNPVGTIVFEPGAEVRHRVSPDRARWKYLISRCYSEGLSKAMIAKMVGADAALESERRYVTHVLSGAIVREVCRAARGQKAGFVGAAAIFVGLGTTTVGYVRGAVNRSR